MKIAEGESYGVSPMLLEKLRRRGLERFTTAQEAALRAGLCSGASLLVSAPTSSGKTTIAELAAVEGARLGHRSVYLVSHRALAEEKYRLFRSEYGDPTSRWFDVSLATGDRVEGNWATGILIATYEKYLAMLCASGDVSLAGVVVVADEIQILGSDNRGPEIELLCTLMRLGKPRQIVALSATISNPHDIAAWLGCAVVQTSARDVPLQHEVWFRGSSITCLAGTTEIFEGRRKAPPSETLAAVEYLLKARLGPLLVFTMTKPRAVQLAKLFAERRQRAAEGLTYVEQFELFSEPSSLVQSLSETAQKKVAFHTADLTYVERDLVERGLRDRLFDVVFATPTLAAGVNFPFQTVLFDSFHRRFIPENPWLPLSEFHNMAGRAGRLGLHEKGYAVLIAESDVHYDRARTLVSAHVEPLKSTFFACSLRKVVLAIIASKVIRRPAELLDFVTGTLWWHQTRDSNPRQLDAVPEMLDRALAYLVGARLVTETGGRLYATRLGVATAATGLLPSTVVDLLEVLRANVLAFSRDSDDWVPACIHAACASPEYQRHGQRHLPYSRGNQPEARALGWLRQRRLFIDPDAVDDMDRVANAAFGLGEWIQGTSERLLRNALPSISYGQMSQLGNEIALLLEGVSRVARVPDAHLPVVVPNALVSLAAQLRFGVPSDVVDLLRAAAAFEVPGFGRHRAMQLRTAGLALPNDIRRTNPDVVAKLVDGKARADALVAAIARFFDAPLAALKEVHAARADGVEIDPKLVRWSYDAVGQDYEEAVGALLSLVQEWQVTKIDKGRRQGFPDILLQFQGKSLLVECKTKQKDTATLSKDEAFAVLTKGADFEKDHSLTLGKPDFDAFSKAKANGSGSISLLRHQDFVEAILRYRAGRAPVALLFEWLMTPGYLSLDQLEALCAPDPT